MGWREIPDEEREEIRKRFSMSDLDELLREVDELIEENEKANSNGI